MDRPMRLPPLNALRAFEAAARHASLTRAAGELGVTHGAVSRQVKALEDHLGVTLFLRRHRGIVLTEPGRALLPSLTAAFGLIAGAVGTLAPSRLLLSCPATLMMRWLIPRMAAFKRLHPEVDIRLSAAHGPVDFVRDGVDLAIRNSLTPMPDGAVAVPFLKESFGPVCHPRLVEEAGLRNPGDLARCRFLHTETRLSAWEDWLSAAGIDGVEVREDERFEHFYFMLQAAASGLGVAIGPSALVEDDIAAGRLVAPFGFVDNGRACLIMAPPQTAARPDARAFIDWLVAVG